ncbi:MAG TPA: phosphoribosylanthranilate isomerase [Eudoraea sp.]|nr:phosphoribosylanthranilate isomerase [Eudoraea sp.]
MNRNTLEVAGLQPDYLGFIFWEPSERYFDNEIPEIDAGIKKIGVFVDAPISMVVEKVREFSLDAAQLHGKESPAYCKELNDAFPEKGSGKAILQQNSCKIIKVFSIMDTFNFNELRPYESVCDYFLFDTKGELPGGNGYAFDWKLLKNYPSSKPYFLSGGIGLEETASIRKFMQTPASRFCHAIDVNSRFETEPGRKDIEKLKQFKSEIIDY